MKIKKLCLALVALCVRRGRRPGRHRDPVVALHDRRPGDRVNDIATKFNAS